MDTITHVMTGAVMSGPAKERLGWVGPAALLAGSFAPDADLVMDLINKGAYFRYHRIITNSIAGMAVFPLLVALVVWYASGRGAPYRTVWLLVLSAYVMHVFMDLTNSYGCKLLWPFSDKWQALDIVFIIDPIVSGLLLISLVLMLMKVRAMPVAAACFALLFGYWGLRYAMHARAADGFRRDVPAAVKVGAFPAAVDPFRWRVVADEGDRFMTGWYDVRGGRLTDTAVYPKPPENEAVLRARQAARAKVFLEFARFPYTSYEKVPDGWLVRFQDLRFSLKPGDKRFVQTVKVLNDGRVAEDRFAF